MLVTGGGTGGAGSLAPLQISVKGGGSPASVLWDGTNSQGIAVASGLYLVQLVSSQNGQSQVVVVKPVQVLQVAGGDVLATAIVAPDPAPAGSPAVWLQYDPTRLMGMLPTCQLYDIAGEKVADSADPGHSGKIDVTGGKQLAGGLYLVRFALSRAGQVDKSRVMKLSILH